MRRPAHTWLRSITLVLCAALGAQARAQVPAPAAEPDLVETIVAEGASAAQGADEDVVETVEGPAAAGDITDAVAASTPDGSGAAEADDATRTKVSGWVRESFEFYPFDGGLKRGDSGDVSGVPRDRLVSRTQLLVRASYQKGRWFEAAISGLVGLGVLVEGSGEDLGLRGWQSQGTREILDATLRELYLGFFGRKLDLRIGQQRVAWGVADVLSPNDVVNARDLRDPFLAEPETLRIPTPLVRATGYWGNVSLELLFSPVFVPDRATVYGHNWSAIQPDAPLEYRGLFALMTTAVDASTQDEVNDAVYQTRLPNRNGGGMAGGAKLAFHASSLDLNLYYHYGYDGTPYLWVDPSLAAVLKATDFAQAGFANLSPVLRAVDQGYYPLFAEYVRRHHVGFDAVTELGPFMLRLDAAYQSQRVFYRADLTSIASPAALGVVSLDYQTGSVDRVLILEGVYVRVLDELDAPLLAYARDSYGVAALMRWPLFWLLGVEARALVGIAPQFYVAQPALTIKTGNFLVKLGALVLGGERNSLGWYYRHNTTAFLQVRYGF